MMEISLNMEILKFLFFCFNGLGQNYNMFLVAELYRLPF